MKLWQQSNLHPIVEKFTVGNDYILDLRLVKYDCLASIAHAKMLGKIGILKSGEVKKLDGELKNIINLHKLGKFKILPEEEDCHTAIENYLTKKLGSIGKKIHTGRSRNDQVLVAIRLYMRQELLDMSRMIVNLQKVFFKMAKRYEFLPMPGYTHTRRAMPSSVGHWAVSFLEELIDDHKLLSCAYNLANQNPLGAVAGFGVDFKIDRQYTSRLLKFNRLQLNSLYAISSRGRLECVVLSVLTKVMMTLARLANDMILFTAQGFNFFILPDNFSTGSSIMPHKKNPDVFEILRGSAHLVSGYRNQAEGLVMDLISGYHRDTQLTKEPIIKSLDLIKTSLEVTALVMAKIKPNKQILMNSLDKDFFTVKAVNLLVKQGMPFRQAYGQVKHHLDKVKAGNPIKIIKEAVSPGAPGNLRLKQYQISKIVA